jgi:hypothetical protein
VWRSEGSNSHPDPGEQPVVRTLQSGTSSIVLPKASVTVLRSSFAEK